MWHRLNAITVWIIGIAIGISRGNADASESPRIVIVGAGIAGLSAAEHLEKHGFTNYVILEAMGRIGGRILTVDMGDGWVEMGAQWIHGQKDNVVYEYAVQHNLVYTDEDNVRENFTAAEFRTDDVWSIDQKLAVNVTAYLLDKMDNFPPETNKSLTLDKYIEEALAEVWAVPSLRRDKELRNKYLRWFQKSLCIYNGCDHLSEMNVESQMDYKECAGNQNVNWKRGYRSFVNTVASNVRNGTIQLRAPVASIELTPEWTRNDTNGTKPVVVVARNGSRYEADHVIVTASLGVLKAAVNNMFVPPLSDAKLQAIKDMGFGTVAKIFMEFEHPFWENGSMGFHLLWSTDRPQTMGNMWDSWQYAITGFYTVPFASNVLAGWLSGDAARYMEQLTSNQLEVMCMNRVLPKFTMRTTFPKLKAITRSSWHSEEFTKGSYSYMTVKAPNRTVANDVLAEPVYVTEKTIKHPAILFAGEATHPHYYSTVHGARESGIREADRIIAFHSVSTSGSSTVTGRDASLVACMGLLMAALLGCQTTVAV